jgi:cytosine/adenosine deaminase-related metal-dependent hydrolase
MGVSGPDRELELALLTARLLQAGVTTAVFSQFDASEDPVAAARPVLDAFDRSGMRVALAVGLLERNLFLDGGDAAFADALAGPEAELARACLPQPPPVEDYLAAVRALAAERGGPRCRVLLGPCGARWLTPATMAAVAEASGPRLGLHMHLLDSPNEQGYLRDELGEPLVPWLDRVGALHPAASFAHGIHATPEDRELLAGRGVTLVCNTSSNLRLNVGLTPVGALRTAGVTVAVGTDDMTLSGDEDFFEEARLAATLARLEDHWISPAELVHMVTAAGARAAGMDERIRTIEPGKRADLTLVALERIARPCVAEGVTPLDLVATRATSRDVAAVLVDGRPLYRDGRHLTHDHPALLAEIAAQVAARSRTPDARARLATSRRMGAALDRLVRARAT